MRRTIESGKLSLDEDILNERWRIAEESKGMFSVYRNGRVMQYDMWDEAAAKKLVKRKAKPGAKVTFEPYDGASSTTTI